MLRRQLNHRWITYQQGGKAEKIGVYLRDSTVRYVLWLGFIDVTAAKLIENAKPVRLEVDLWTPLECPTDWEPVPSDKFVQGCLTSEGVYTVIEVNLKLV
jgi:hypothetical protein